MTSPNELAYWPALVCSGELPRARTKEILFRWTVQEGRPLSELFALAPAELRQHLHLDGEEAQQLAAAQARASEWTARLATLSNEGTFLLTRDDPAYPEALVQRLSEVWLPYCFFFRGDLALLADPALAVLGASAPTALAAEVARELAGRLAAGGYHLVGNYARGIDRAGLDAARAAQGYATIVLPLGMAGFEAGLNALGRDLRSGRLLVLSPYPPDQAYTPTLGTASLGLVTTWAEAVFLVEPDIAPEDWPNVERAIEGGVQMFVWSGAGDEATRLWTEAGATVYDDAEAAFRELADRFGAAPTPAVEGDEGSIDELAGVEPIAFADAESAIEALGRSGRVPPRLAERLRNSEWPGDIEVFDVDVNLHEDEGDTEPPRQ